MGVGEGRRHGSGRKMLVWEVWEAQWWKIAAGLDNIKEDAKRGVPAI